MITRSPLLISYLNVLKPYCSCNGIQFYEDYSMDDDAWICSEEADLIILITKNANFSPYQKSMGQILGRASLLRSIKLIAIATSNPYDFLEDRHLIRNYIAIYEPTVSAFKAAVDIIFDFRTARGSLPMSLPWARPTTRPVSGTLKRWKKGI